jgi:hypothetical protein
MKAAAKMLNAETAIVEPLLGVLVAAGARVWEAITEDPLSADGIVRVLLVIFSTKIWGEYFALVLVVVRDELAEVVEATLALVVALWLEDADFDEDEVEVGVELVLELEELELDDELLLVVLVEVLEGVGVELELEVDELDDDVDDGVGVVELELLELEEDNELLLLEPELPLPDESPPPLLKTTMLAVLPCGTVTTQNAAPPAPSVLAPVISLTPLVSGSISQGRPLQPPSGHSILAPQLGISSLNGVAGSR